MHNTCEQYAALISAAVDGEISSEERRDLMNHLAQCPACRETYTQMLLMHDAFDQWEEEPPVGLAASVMEQIHQEHRAAPRRRRHWVQLGAAAACCALIVIGAQVGRTLIPSAGSDAVPDGASATDPYSAVADGTSESKQASSDGDSAASNGSASTNSSHLEEEDPSVDTSVTAFGTSPEDRSSQPSTYGETPLPAAITVVSSDQRLSDWMNLHYADGEVSEDTETNTTLTAWTISSQQYAELEQYLTEESIPCEITGEVEALSDESTVRVVFLAISADPAASLDTDAGTNGEIPSTDE